MADDTDLDNMKRLAKVKIDEMRLAPLALEPALRLVMDVGYSVISDEGTVLYTDRVADDVSDKPNIGEKNFGQLMSLAVTMAKRQAKKKWGK